MSRRNRLRGAARKKAAGAAAALLHVGGACIAGVAGVAAAQEADGPMALVVPLEGSEIIAKKPEIEVAIGAPYTADTLQVLLDGVDVTGLIEPTDGGFRYTPRQVLPGGEHVLAVYARAADGSDLVRELRFATRHTERFRELSSAVQAAVEGERLADRRDAPPPEPTYRGEGELVYGLRAAGRRRWESSVDANLWFQNQKLPVFTPPREGLDLASLTLQSTRTGERGAFRAGVGDVQIMGTQRSIASLARRGATLGFERGPFSLGGFAVDSRQLFGFTGGTGIGTDPDTNIYGVQTGFALRDDKLRFDVIHARGGEPGSSLGLFTASGATRGRVTGYALAARPSPLLTIEAEYDAADFDADPTDALPGVEDDAYAVRLGGQKSAFNYQLSYERLGPDYAVVASPINRDQKNLAASGGFAFAKHSLSVTALRQHDNVDGDPTRARLGNREGSVDWSYAMNERWIVGAGYRDSLVSSSYVPEGLLPQEVETRGLTGRVQYMGSPWLVSLELQRSEQDDVFVDGNDSDVWTRSLAPSFQSGRLSVVPLLAVTTITFAGGGELEQRNLSLMLNGETGRGRFGYGIALTAYGQETSDGTLDTDTESAELRLAYRLRHRASERPRGEVALRATRFDTTDRITGLETRDWGVWLTFTITPRYAF